MYSNLVVNKYLHTVASCWISSTSAYIFLISIIHNLDLPSFVFSCDTDCGFSKSVSKNTDDDDDDDNNNNNNTHTYCGKY